MALKTIEGHTFQDDIPQNATIVDLGANVGNFTAQMLLQYPSAMYYLFEGNPNLMPPLRKRFEGNGNVNVVDALVGAARAESADFYLSLDCQASSTYLRIASHFGLRQSQAIHVKMVTIDDILLSYKLDRIDLLKVDIEGSEWDLFDQESGSFTDTHFKKIRQISVEFHDFLDTSLMRRTEVAVKHLLNLGYILYQGNENTAPPSISAAFRDRNINPRRCRDCLFYKNGIN